MTGTADTAAHDLPPDAEAPGVDSESLRAEPRTALFAAVLLVHGPRTLPVRMRNLSAHGALLEGDRLPPSGTMVEMRRGPIHVPALVRWQDGNRAGIQFDFPVEVDDWLPSNARNRSKSWEAALAMQPARIALEQRLAEESAAKRKHDANSVAAALETLGEALSDDTHVLMNHGDALQAIDLAVQWLRRLA